MKILGNVRYNMKLFQYPPSNSNQNTTNIYQILYSKSKHKQIILNIDGLIRCLPGDNFTELFSNVR